MSAEDLRERLRGLWRERALLNDQLDAHDFAEPPKAIPAELKQRDAEVSAQISAVEAELRGTPKIALMPVEPLESGETLAFVDGPGVHGMAMVPVASYPASPRGEALRAVRVQRHLSLRDVGEPLGLSAADVSSLERGRVTTDDAGWLALADAISAASMPSEEA